MGEHRVSSVEDQENMQRFMRQLLDDINALDYMLEHEWFEVDPIHIGAEQEFCIIDKETYKPAPIAMEALELMKDHPWIETELAKFNLELNLTPQEFTGNCLSALDNEIRSHLEITDKALDQLGATSCLTGILPTLRKKDLNLHNLTPQKRYKMLLDAFNAIRREDSYRIKLTGIDELLVSHDTPLIEASNTSFQIHLQVNPAEFVKMYNIAQTLTGPIISIAANSPLVFGKRLWHESRIALFQQALDVRGAHDHLREWSPRVNFGTSWLENSMIEMYKEDITRFRILLAAEIEENSKKKIQKGKVPKLAALQVHNGTVYRWNRACYGISGSGKPHLRIENRVVPSGPTIKDEIANAAFWLGAMKGIANNYEDITKHISFADIQDNFRKAARFGIDSKFTWLNDKKISAADLITEILLPLAKDGLESQGVNSNDTDQYLKIIKKRSKAHMTGARWSLRAYTKLLDNNIDEYEAATILTASMLKNQEQSLCVHKWPEIDPNMLDSYSPAILTVEEFMIKDLITVQKEDIIDFVAEIMNWRRIRYLPVESKDGKLEGLVTSRSFLKHYLRLKANKDINEVTIEDIMIKDLITIGPDAPIKEAMEIMRSKEIGSLPVVKDDELIGIITEMDFLRISNRLIERQK